MRPKGKAAPAPEVGWGDGAKPVSGQDGQVMGAVMEKCEICGREPFFSHLQFRATWRDKYLHFCSSHCFHVWNPAKHSRKDGL